MAGESNSWIQRTYPDKFAAALKLQTHPDATNCAKQFILETLELYKAEASAANGKPNTIEYNSGLNEKGIPYEQMELTSIGAGIYQDLGTDGLRSVAMNADNLFFRVNPDGSCEEGQL